MSARKNGRWADPLSGIGTRPLTEIGYVEYPTLIHALWKECLSVIRTWRYAQSTGGRDRVFWYGVYRTGTEIRIAATGPHGVSAALALRDAMNAIATEAGTAETQSGSVHEGAGRQASPKPNHIGETNDR